MVAGLFASKPKMTLGQRRALEYYDTLAGYAKDDRKLYDEYSPTNLEYIRSGIDRYRSPGKIAYEEGRAASDVAKAYEQQRGTLRRGLARFGVGPRSGRFSTAMQNLALGEAMSTAGARTSTRHGLLDRALGAEMDFSNVLGGLRGTAASGLSAAGAGAGHIGNVEYEAVNKWKQARAQAIGQLVGTGLSIVAPMAAPAMFGGSAAAASAGSMARGYAGSAALGGSYGPSGFGDTWSPSAFACDRRLKFDIKQCDVMPNGLPIYDFKYLDDPDTVYVGPMADEVKTIMPQHYGEIGGFGVINAFGIIDEFMALMESGNG